MDQPPTTPGGGAQPPDWGEMGQKLKSAQGPNRIILIAGLVFVVDSFLPWYGVKGFLAQAARAAGISPNIKGWSSGGLAVFAILLAIAATALAVIEVLGLMKDQNMPTAPLMLGLTVGAFTFAILRFLTQTSLTKYGLYIAIVAGGAMAYAGYQKFQTSKT
jgi:hypothetical protein